MKTLVLLPLCAALALTFTAQAQDNELPPRPEARDRGDFKPDGEKPEHRMREHMRRSDGFHRDGMREDAKHAERGHERPPFAHSEGPERLHHIMQAVEHLRAAGLNEPADNIEKIARHMREELERARHDSASAPQEAEHMQHAMQEMHGELQKMAHAIDELREQVAKMRNEGKGE